LFQQLRSLIDHVVGARFPVPPVLYNAFEAWRCLSYDNDEHHEPQRRFAAVFVQVARGGSVRCDAGSPPTGPLPCLPLTPSTLYRDALRAQFPTLCITRKAAHAFAETTVPLDFFFRYDSFTPLVSMAGLLPLRALRIAQLHALGMDTSAASFVSELLMPPAPCATEGAERLLMDAARFLIRSGFIPQSDQPDADTSGAAFDAQRHAFRAEQRRNNPNQLLSNPDDVLSDLGFYLHAGEARPQPLCGAFSFSDRTLASVTRLAAEHRRDALVLDAMDDPCSYEDCVGEHVCVSGWHAGLMWDDACVEMLALRSGRDAELGDMRWSADEHELRCSPSYSSCGITTLHGEWHMHWLRTWAAVRHEGKEQHNCLEYDDDGSCLGALRDSSYWSLRFTPNAAGQQAMEKGGRMLRRSVASLRLTVYVADGYVQEALGPRNDKPPLAALNALEYWGHCADVDVQYIMGYSSDEDDDEDDDDDDDDEDDDADYDDDDNDADGDGDGDDDDVD
jgi:hypothetical protein